MTTVHDVERAVRELPTEDLRRFRQWFAEFDAAVWDAQFEDDASSGTLDDLADEALRDRVEGHTLPL